MTNTPTRDDFRKAFDQEAFHLVYQPQVSVSSGRITGSEALLRWISDEFGFVPPPQIISLAKECNQMSELGYWILKESCRQNKAWNQAPSSPSVKMAINVSPVQFLQENYNLHDDIRTILQETDLSPNLLELEITEEAMVQDFEKTREIISEIAELGITFALDDFGTGYSSLSYLSKMPFDILKIDREFIGELDVNERKKKLVDAIVALGRALNMSVLAEGVERLEQLEHLRKQGCHFYQGYLYGKPLPPEKFHQLISSPGGSS